MSRQVPCRQSHLYPFSSSSCLYPTRFQLETNFVLSQLAMRLDWVDTTGLVGNNSALDIRNEVYISSEGVGILLIEPLALTKKKKVKATGAKTIVVPVESKRDEDSVERNDASANDEAGLCPRRKVKVRLRLKESRPRETRKR
jgi:hypothetical protein